MNEWIEFVYAWFSGHSCIVQDMVGLAFGCNLDSIWYMGRTKVPCV